MRPNEASVPPSEQSKVCEFGGRSRDPRSNIERPTLIIVEAPKRKPTHPIAPISRAQSFSFFTKKPIHAASPSTPAPVVIAPPLATPAAPDAEKQVAKSDQQPKKGKKQKPRTKALRQQVSTLQWLTIEEAATKFPFSASAIRHLVFQAEAYAKDPKPGLKSNGFLSVIVRRPGVRRVFLDEKRFMAWMTQAI